MHTESIENNHGFNKTMFRKYIDLTNLLNIFLLLVKMKISYSIKSIVKKTLICGLHGCNYNMLLFW